MTTTLPSYRHAQNVTKEETRQSSSQSRDQGTAAMRRQALTALAAFLLLAGCEANTAPAPITATCGQSIRFMPQG